MPQRHNPVDLLSGYLFVRFDIASGIHTRHQVICHPSQHWVISVVDFLAQHQSLQYLHRWVH